MNVIRRFVHETTLQLQELNDSMPSAVIEDDKESVADEKEKKSNFLVKIPQVFRLFLQNRIPILDVLFVSNVQFTFHLMVIK